MSLRRISTAENAVHACLALGDAAVSNQRHPENVVQRGLIGVSGL